MIISVTERQLYKRCRRRWDLSSYNRQSLTPILNSPALDLGTIIHRTLELWTEDPNLDPNEIYSQVSSDLIQKIVLDYNQRVGCAPNQEELMPITQAIMLGRAMINNYKTHWRTPLPAGYTLIRNEQVIVEPIPNTEHYICVQHNINTNKCMCERCCYVVTDRNDLSEECNPNNCDCAWCIEQVYHMLEGTLDGIMADELGQLFIIERKTYSRKPSIEELDRNDQFLAYTWLAQQANIGPIRGVSYDGLFKKDRIPSGKTLPDMFLRRILMRPQKEIDEFQNLLALEANEMANPNVAIYKTVPVLGGCWDCSYTPLCDAISMSPQHHVDTVMQMYQRSNNKRWRDNVDE